MRKFNFRFLKAFIALALLSIYTASAVTSRTPLKHVINNTTMADAWILIRQHGRGRDPANRGGGGRVCR